MSAIKAGDIIEDGNDKYEAISCDDINEDYICMNCDLLYKRKCKEIECFINDLYFKKKQNE